MAHRLQTATARRSSPMSSVAASQVLPQVPGVLYLLNNSRNMLRAAAEWDRRATIGPTSARPTAGRCAAARPFRQRRRRRVVCHHVTGRRTSATAAPMLAQGETLGLLCIEGTSGGRRRAPGGGACRDRRSLAHRDHGGEHRAGAGQPPPAGGLADPVDPRSAHRALQPPLSRGNAGDRALPAPAGQDSAVDHDDRRRPLQALNRYVRTRRRAMPCSSPSRRP